MIKFFMSFSLLRESFNQKSLLRTVQNREFYNQKLEGNVIDLGARNGDASYYKFFDTENAKITFVDKYSDSQNVLNIDLEEDLPIDNAEYDYALSINLFEHIFNVQNLIEETYRILKDGGELVGATPFSKEYHADPNDYYRFTQDFYQKIFQIVGFKEIKIVPVGVGLFHSIANDLTRIIRLKIIRYLIWVLFINLDRLLNRFYKNNHNFYCSLVFYCKK